MFKKSFTLIEIVVVVIIVAILGVIVAASSFRSIERARIARLANDCKTLKNAASGLNIDVGHFSLSQDYAPSPSPVDMKETDIAGNVLNLPGWNGPYVGTALSTPWSTPYRYDNDGDCFVENGDIYRGINIVVSRSDATLSPDAFQALGQKTDQVIDGVVVNGETTGIFRYDADNFLYLINSGCRNR